MQSQILSVATTDWTPKLFWYLHDPLEDDPSIPTWELVAEIAGHRFGLATAWQQRLNGTWAWCVQGTDTGGDGTDPDGAVSFIREALPQWAAIIPDFPRELRIIVSGTGPDVALVEVENVNGHSVAPDTMRTRPDGTRELVFFGTGGGR